MDHKRYRATTIVIRDGHLLLVRDQGRHKFSLPGGGFKRGESTIEAGARELLEEVGLITLSAKRLKSCDVETRYTKHKVCLLGTRGEPYLKSREIDEFLWWDMDEEIPLYPNVTSILSRLEENLMD